MIHSHPWTYSSGKFNIVYFHWKEQCVVYVELQRLFECCLLKLYFKQFPKRNSLTARLFIICFVHNSIYPFLIVYGRWIKSHADYKSMVGKCFEHAWVSHSQRLPSFAQSCMVKDFSMKRRELKRHLLNSFSVSFIKLLVSLQRLFMVTAFI